MAPNPRIPAFYTSLSHLLLFAQAGIAHLGISASFPQALSQPLVDAARLLQLLPQQRVDPAKGLAPGEERPTEGGEGARRSSFSATRNITLSFVGDLMSRCLLSTNHNDPTSRPPPYQPQTPATSSRRDCGIIGHLVIISPSIKDPTTFLRSFAS